MDSPDATLTTLYVATTGNDSNSGTSPQAPLRTIGRAVALAVSTYLPQGPVEVEVAGGTYAEQITINFSTPYSLTITGSQDPTNPTVVEPSALTLNLTEGNTGYFFDDNVGNTAAIIGIYNTRAAVVIQYLTISGASLSPPPGPWSGLAYINASGSASNNNVVQIQIPAILGQTSVHGIEVKSTSGTAAVTLTQNRLSDYPGHVAIALLSGGETSGILDAVVSGNRLIGNPTTQLAPVAQFGIVAAGVRQLTITENRISDFSSPWNVGGIWLDPLAPDAQCEVTYNSLFNNDNGIDVRGASGCLIAHNAILAGSAGIELGAQVTSTGTPVASSNNVIRANSIQGATTVATTLVTVNGTTTTPAVAQAPLDGVLVWDGQNNQMQGNHITEFVTLVYIGEDPAYLNNSATWPSGAMPSYDNSGNALHDNLLARLATPAAGSGITGWAVANLNNQASFVVDATNNWWGSGNGPEAASNTFNVGAQGLPVTNGVLYTPWLLFAPPLDAAALLGFSPVVNLSTGVGYPSIAAAVSQSLSGATLGLASGVFSEAVTIVQPGLGLAPLPGTERPAIVGPGTAGAATVSIVASGVSLVGLLVQNPAPAGTPGQAIAVQGTAGSPVADVTLEGLQVVGGESGILIGPYVQSANVTSCEVQHFWSVGISVGDYRVGGQETSATVLDTVVSAPLPFSGGQSGIRVVNGATATLRANAIAELGLPESEGPDVAGIVLEDVSGVVVEGNQIRDVAVGIAVFSRGRSPDASNWVMNGILVSQNRVSYSPMYPGAPFPERGLWLAALQANASVSLLVVGNQWFGENASALARGLEADTQGGSASAAGSQNQILGWGTGVALSGDQCVVDLSFNDLVGNLTQARSAASAPASLANNWWGAPVVPSNVSGALVLLPILLAPVDR